MSHFQNLTVLEEPMAEILRQKTPAERMAIANGMWCFARDMLRANIAREHPEWSEEAVSRMVARRLSHGSV